MSELKHVYFLNIVRLDHHLEVILPPLRTLQKYLWGSLFGNISFLFYICYNF